MNYEILAKEAHLGAIEKGFWEASSNISTKKMLIISEIGEAVESDRKGKRTCRELYERKLRNKPNMREGKPEDRWKTHCFVTHIKDTVEDELADVAIRVFDLIGYYYGAPNFPYASLNEQVDDDPVIHLTGEEFSAKCYALCVVLIIEDITTFLKTLINFCEKEEIDLKWHIREKMNYNKTRDKLHGKSY